MTQDTYRIFLRETIKSFKICNSFGSFRTSLRMISSSSLRELLLFTSNICPVPCISHLMLNPCSSFSLRITSIGRCLALPLIISLKNVWKKTRIPVFQGKKWKGIWRHYMFSFQRSARSRLSY